jgi:rod shape-determining protein MreC
VAAPTLAERRPEVVLALLLSACLVALSLQVRRAGGRTVGEGWLLTAVSPFVDLVTSVRSGIGEVGTWASSRRALRASNRELSVQLEELRGEVLRLRDAEKDKGRLLELFGAQPSPPPGTVPARLIAVESSGPFHTALLDRGSGDGLGLDGVVLARGGLLGRVISLGPRTARVQLLSDATAAVGILLTHASRDSRAAVAKGDGKGGISVEYVPTIDPVEANDALVSSGTDGLYPGGLPVGRVASVRRNKTLFWEIQVSAAADPHRESLVFVLPPVRKSDVTSGPSVVERR